MGTPEILAAVMFGVFLWALAFTILWLARFTRGAIDAYRLARLERIRKLWRETDAVLGMHERHMKAAPTTEEIMRARQEKGL